MVDKISIALAQINPKVGAILAAADEIRRARSEAANAGADLVVFGELVLCGYPPEDLVRKPVFQNQIEVATRQLAAETGDGGPAILIGAPWRVDGYLYNAALLLDGGEISQIRLKHELPNYGVFDEKRVFAEGPLPGPISFRGLRLGVMICEDMWFEDVTECLNESGAEILVILNGSPYEVNKYDTRLNHSVARVSESNLPLIYVNLVGGQDELVFDGGSYVIGADCSLRARAPQFEKKVLITDWQRLEDSWVCEEGPIAESLEESDATYRAMVLGLRDYVGKNNFPGILLGLSGGIDSALSAAVAVDAIGPERVHCVMMPSPYTSQESLEDAATCAALLGAELDTINITPALKVFDKLLAKQFTDKTPDTTEENIQARSRGLTLMALSNKLGYMVLSTGNKSEMSVGYSTLYGDMCGGYSVLKDVYKTTVYDLSRRRNASKPEYCLGPVGIVMPENIINKPPTAELKPDQKDQDTLPPYDELDAVLIMLIEDDMAVDDIVAKGHDQELVHRVWRMLDLAEYKRRQAPPGVKITRRAFGRDRRYPITNGFKDDGYRLL